jgi:group I intron endonuclease
MRITFIYVLIDPITNEIKYVGKSDKPDRRFKKHLKEDKNTYKNNWIKSLTSIGQEPIMEIMDEVLFSEWSFWEKYWISQLKSWGFKLTNLTEGGDGGNFGYLVNKKISEKLKGRVLTDEWKENISKSRKGKKLSEKTKNKLSEKLLGNNRAKGLEHSEDFKLYMSNKFTGKNNPMFGKKHRLESVEKIKKVLSEKNKGINNPFYGKKHTQNSKNKMCKKLIQKDLNGNVIKIWDSFKEACESLNLKQPAISNVCNKPNRTYANYKWETYGN